MLDQLLEGQLEREFFDTHYHRLPFARPGAVEEAAELLDWPGLTAKLAAASDAELLVVRDGRLLSDPHPRNEDELRALLAEGASVVVRKAELLDPRLAEMALSFGNTIGGPATVHLFATPEGHHSFGWHYDAEDVFLIQCDGHKDMYLRQNTVNPEPTLQTMPKDMQFEKETTPLQVCSLLPGDWLYIPRGWWHVARCQSACLTISVGILSEQARR